MLNTLVPRTEITYQELGLLLDGTLANQIVDEINPDYLKKNQSGLHTIFRLLPIEEIMNFLNSYYQRECSITKSISLLKNKILKLLKKSELVKFSNNNSNKRMIDLVLTPFLNLQMPNEINNYASNYRINIIIYFCTLVKFFIASEHIQMKWAELFIMENIGAKDIEERDFPTLHTRNITSENISCEPGIIKRFSTSLSLAISPILPILEEVITFENFENVSIRTPIISNLREDLKKITLNSWYKNFNIKHENDEFTTEGLKTAWNTFFTENWNKSKFVTEFHFPRYEEVKNSAIIKQIYDEVFEIIQSDYKGYLIGEYLAGKKKARRKSRKSYKRVKTKSRKINEINT